MVLLFGLSATLGVRATTFFGDISGNQIASGYAVGPGGGLDNGVAEGFTMTQTMSLTSVDIYLSQFQAASGSNLALSIFSDASGLPGSDLYDLSTNVSGTTSSTPTEATFSGTGSFTLNGGTHYWFELYATNVGSSTGNTVLWNVVGAPGSFNPVNPTGSGATDNGQLRSVNNGGSFTGPPSTSESRAAFELNGTVPEPASLALLGFGGILLTVRRRAGAPKAA
jgi:hypothetical protein